MKVLRRLALIIILVLLAGAGATPALAGEYPVYACDPAHGNVNGAWAGFTGGGGTLVEENCPTPRGPNPWQQGLVARHIPGVTSPRNAIARVTFTAPPGASLSRMSYDHRFCGGATFNAGIINAAGTWLHYSGPLSCGTLVLSPNTLSLGGTPWVSFAASASTTRARGCRNHGIRRDELGDGLGSDSTAPQLAVTGGSATTPGWKRGPIDLGYQASDNTGVAYADVAAGPVARQVLGAVQPSSGRTVPEPGRRFHDRHPESAGRRADGAPQERKTRQTTGRRHDPPECRQRSSERTPGPERSPAVADGANPIRSR